MADIIKQAEQLSLAEQLAIIAYLADRSCMLAGTHQTDHPWSDVAGIIDYPLFGEDAQAYIAQVRAENDHIRENRLRDAQPA